MNMNSESLKPESEKQCPINDHGFSMKMNPKSSKPVLVCAFGLLFTFFLPWLRQPFINLELPGYSLGPLGVGDYVWLIPLLAGATILLSFLGINNRIIGAITGMVSISVIIYAFFPMYVGFNKVRWSFFDQLLIGAKLTGLLSIAIIVSANVGSPNLQKKAVKYAKRGDELQSAETGGKKFTLVAALLNFFWSGAGNYYLGQKTKGLVFFSITLLIILFSIFNRYNIHTANVLMWIHTLYTITMITDAVLLTSRINKGEVIKDWDFFKFKTQIKEKKGTNQTG